MRAAIVIDKWKLPVFKKHLNAAGYSFEEKGDLTNNTMVLVVDTEVPASLKTVVEQCQAECRDIKQKARH